MATTNLDSAKLKAAQSGGLIREDVMDEIWNISNIPLPFSDSCGSLSCDNSFFEWTKDKLRVPDLTNARIDGQDADTTNDTNLGNRLGNQCQISTKTVQVSSRADASDSIGVDTQLAYQVMMRQRELRRDREAIMLSNQGSIADDGSAVAGTLASIFAMIVLNGSHGATGSTPGYNNGTKLFPAVTAGTKRGLTETIVRDQIQAAYLAGGDVTVMMARPGVIRKWSEYCFTSSARIATLMNDEGSSQSPMTAKGAVNVFVTDFGTITMRPNRLQPEVGGAGTKVSNILLADFEYIKMVTLRGYQVEPLAKKGLAEKRMMSVDQTLMIGNEEACAAIYDIDETVAVVQ